MCLAEIARLKREIERGEEDRRQTTLAEVHKLQLQQTARQQQAGYALRR